MAFLSRAQGGGAALSSGWIEQLDAATRTADADRIRALFPQLDPGNEDLVSTLEDYLKDFRFDEILAVTQPLVRPRPEP